MCVLGLGLIGGSLLRALAAAGRPAWGYNRSAKTVRDAVADGFDATTDLPAALARAAEQDALIVIAVPTPIVGQIAAAIAQHAPGCAITDVVSVKGPVREAVEAHGLLDRFVGGHPMAGTAESGWAAGDGELFRVAVWVVTVDGHEDAGVWTQVATMALDVGAVVVPAESAEHDAAVARISHLPHLLAEALASVGADSQLALSLAAGSFRDGTRVAATAPELVRAMCEANAGPLLGALDEALELLTQARASLAADHDLTELTNSGHEGRLNYEQTQRSEIRELEPGIPGWLEQLRDAGRAGGIWMGGTA